MPPGNHRIVTLYTTMLDSEGKGRDTRHVARMSSGEGGDRRIEFQTSLEYIVKGRGREGERRTEHRKEGEKERGGGGGRT